MSSNGPFLVSIDNPSSVKAALLRACRDGNWNEVSGLALTGLYSEAVKIRELLERKEQRG